MRGYGYVHVRYRVLSIHLCAARMGGSWFSNYGIDETNENLVQFEHVLASCPF